MTSKKKEGSTFYFEVPVKIVGEHNQIDVDSSHNYQLKISQKVKVLIVDDAISNIDLLMEILDNENIYCDVAFDGLEALNKVEKVRYDIVLLDLEMPKMSGREVMKILREQYSSDMIVYLLTASILNKDKDTYLSEGFDGLLIKPFNITDIYKIFTDHIEGSYVEKRSQKQEIEKESPPTTFSINIPQDLSRQMREALDNGDIRAVEDLLLANKSIDAQVKKRLLQMVDRYEFDKLLGTVGGELDDERDDED